MDPHFGAAHHPTVDVGIGSVDRIVVGNVLQIASSRIQAQTPFGGYIAEPHPALNAKNPAMTRHFDWVCRVPHDAQTL